MCRIRSAATANAKYRGSSLTHPCAATVLCSSASAAHAPTVTSTPPDAYSRGCRAFLCDHRLDLGDGVCEVVCADTRAALASVSAEFYGNPAKKLRIIGITGTKGKTTTSLMTAAILNGAGIPVCIYRLKRRDDKGPPYRYGEHDAGRASSFTIIFASWRMRGSIPSQWRCPRRRLRTTG